MAMRDETHPDSPRASTGCCGCLGGQWPRKPASSAQTGQPASSGATQQWNTVSPSFLVPPSSPVSLEGSAVQSSVPTPSNRSTSPLDDEDLDLGFFTKEHRASFVDGEVDIAASSRPQLTIVSPPSPSTSDGAPAGTVDLLSSEEESPDPARSPGFAPFPPQDLFGHWEGSGNHKQEIAGPSQPDDSGDDRASASESSDDRASASESSDERAFAIPRLASPAAEAESLRQPRTNIENAKDEHRPVVPTLATPEQFHMQKARQKELDEGVAEAERSRQIEYTSRDELRPVVPMLATPEQFHIQKARQKELEEGEKAKQIEEAKAKAETRLQVPALASPEEVRRKQAKRKELEEAEAEALMERTEARQKESQVVIPRLEPPRSSLNDEETPGSRQQVASVPTVAIPVPRLASPEEKNEDRIWKGEHGEAGQSPRYVELVSRVEQLSLDLETTKSREQKSRLLLEWSELRANSLEGHVSGLSEELTQQQALYLDLQARHLTHMGITLPGPEIPSTSFPCDETSASENCGLSADQLHDKLQRSQTFSDM